MLLRAPQTLDLTGSSYWEDWGPTARSTRGAGSNWELLLGALGMPQGSNWEALGSRYWECWGIPEMVTGRRRGVVGRRTGRTGL